MTTLRLIQEGKAAPSKPVRSPQDTYNLMKFLAAAERETFYVLHLDALQHVLARELKELAGWLKVKPKWIYDRTHLKEIPHYKVKGLLMFRKKDIDKWLVTHKVPVVNVLARNFQLITKRR